MGIRVGGRALRDFRFIYLERSARYAGMEGTRGRSAGEWGGSSRASANSSRTNLRGETTSRGL